MIDLIKSTFQEAADPSLIPGMTSYMKGQFKYLGLRSPVRKEAQKIILKQTGPIEGEALRELVEELWFLPEREYKYFAIDLLTRRAKKAPEHWIDFYEKIIEHEAWWDTIDGLASNVLGPYFKNYKHQVVPYTDKWTACDNFWFKRCAIIYQLKYKDETDFFLLTDIINRNLGSKEFFINKAIGWSLRQYSRFNPEAVVEFVNDTPDLANLSKKEALRLLK